MCQAPSISFISSPCLQPVEADPDTHCTDTEAGSGRGRHTPRSHSHQGRLGFEPALDQDWTPSCLSVHGGVDAHPGLDPSRHRRSETCVDCGPQAPPFMPRQGLRCPHAPDPALGPGPWPPASRRLCLAGSSERTAVTCGGSGCSVTPDSWGVR